MSDEARAGASLDPGGGGGDGWRGVAQLEVRRGDGRHQHQPRLHPGLPAHHPPGQEPLQLADLQTDPVPAAAAAETTIPTAAATTTTTTAEEEEEAGEAAVQQRGAGLQDADAGDVQRGRPQDRLRELHLPGSLDRAEAGGPCREFL